MDDEDIADLKFSIDMLAETYIVWLAEGRSERAWWKWVRNLINSRANTMMQGTSANDP